MLLSENAKLVLERRYLKKDEKGAVEQPEDMFLRVAQTIAAAAGPDSNSSRYFCDVTKVISFRPAFEIVAAP